MLRPGPTPTQCRCAQPAPFTAGRRLLPVYETEPAVLIQAEVAVYCTACFSVMEPTGKKFRVTEAQVRFDLKSQDTILIGAEGDWSTLGMHDWHALKRYGVPQHLGVFRSERWPAATSARRDEWAKITLPELRRMKLSELEAATKLDRRTLQRIRAGQKPHPRKLAVLTEIVRASNAG